VHRRTPAPLTDEKVERVLNDLANLRLDARPVLGDRTPAANAVNKSKGNSQKKPLPVVKKPSVPIVSESQHSSLATNVIDISDDDVASEDSLPAPRDKIPTGTKLPKAVQLRQLASDVGRVGDNIALGHVVDEFVRILHDTGSRNLTKEGFAVLDALVKQLADPSVFVVPLRRTRTLRSSVLSSENGAGEAAQPRRTKATKLVTLRRGVHTAQSNKELADMVQDFGRVTDASNGRTITKDGYAFLEGLATRLKEIG
jgi:casein kinase 1